MIYDPFGCGNCLVNPTSILQGGCLRKHHPSNASTSHFHRYANNKHTHAYGDKNIQEDKKYFLKDTCKSLSHFDNYRSDSFLPTAQFLNHEDFSHQFFAH